MAESLLELARRRLTTARERTQVLGNLADPELLIQHSPLMSPPVWDLAHIGQQEELWLLRGGNLDQPGILPKEIDQLYDAFRHSRTDRSQLPLLPPTSARDLCQQVRDRVWQRLAEEPTDLFPYLMVAQHEQQHVETLLASMQLRSGPALLTGIRPWPVESPGLTGELRAVPELAHSQYIPGGPFQLGVDAQSEPESLDNERPAQLVDLPPFRLGTFPVTTAHWREFQKDGGYRNPKWWRPQGWQHCQQAELTAPLFWHSDGSRTRFGVREDIPALEPVQHISFYEAEAFAAWAGARLPTEAEWEKACAWDPAGHRRKWPWGEAPVAADRANLGGAALGPAPVGTFPQGRSAYGVEQLMGDVWEWTSSRFRPWPGFTPMCYSQYSQPFFGEEYYVLRGGSWAVGSGAIRPSFRNWDYPIRRQIFCGMRLAWDA